VRTLFIFIDGVGLGGDSPANPFSNIKTPGINKILDGADLTDSSADYSGKMSTLLALDATLGTPGLPQSATGQATIFTGENAPALINKHLNGFPDQRLRQLLAAKGMFRAFKRKGYRVSFANAYRPLFFNKLRYGLPGVRYSCSTLVTFYGGVSFYSVEDIKSGNALFMDITNDILIKMGCSVPLFSPDQGARQLYKISAGFDFCLFEYFLTDLAGHLGEPKESERVISILDQFIGTLADLINPAEEFLIISSDHGNIEDLTTRKHTLNKVPALLIGNKALRAELKNEMNDLTDILPALNRMLEWEGGSHAGH
jgi:hypothetical protein